MLSNEQLCLSLIDWKRSRRWVGLLLGRSTMFLPWCIRNIDTMAVQAATLHLLLPVSLSLTLRIHPDRWTLLLGEAFVPDHTPFWPLQVYACPEGPRRVQSVDLHPGPSQSY